MTLIVRGVLFVLLGLLMFALQGCDDKCTPEVEDWPLCKPESYRYEAYITADPGTGHIDNHLNVTEACETGAPVFYLHVYVLRGDLQLSRSGISPLECIQEKIWKVKPK